MDHASLFVSHDVLDVAAGVVSATTANSEVVGQLKKRVWSRDSINIIIEEIESLLQKIRSQYCLFKVKHRAMGHLNRGIGPSGDIRVGETCITIGQDRTQGIAPKTDPFGRCSIYPEILEISRRPIIDRRIIGGTVVTSGIWRRQVEVVLINVQPECKVGAICSKVELIKGDVREACHRARHGVFPWGLDGDFVCDGSKLSKNVWHVYIS